MPRPDDYLSRRAHLAGLSDEELYDRFWKLADELVDPMLQAGKIYTSPAVERSVLLRMGFSSIEAKPIVDGLLERKLLGHGAGNAVWRLARELNLPVREAGVALSQGKYWDKVAELFEKGGEKHE
ncbi:MAG: ornithine aminomutase subunit alpha [Clostridiales bacterium]|nr:ornithine aminomutase subunit alpha [Clostridiales bacterium]MDD7432677.1 ornithine aminomutase subunit alpha [Clostridiales bacterium]MDY3060909.1 ornithine aminomutase subunit alpha [Eubacteriales bacterium]